MTWHFDLAKLTTLRQLKNLTRKDCATAINKTEESYRLKEAGRSPFTVAEICAISSAFGVDPRAFFVCSPENSSVNQEVA